MKTATITEDGKFVIPPYIQARTGLMPGAAVEYDTDGATLVVRLSSHKQKPTAKPIWELAGMFKTDQTMTIEEMDEAAMETVAAHCLGKDE